MASRITGESIKSAIAQKLSECFSGTPPVFIYKEEMTQGFKRPCFFIWNIDTTQEELLQGYYSRDYMMNIRFHAEKGDTKTYETLSEIGNTLMVLLDTINIPIVMSKDSRTGELREGIKPVKGYQMNFNIREDVLQFFVTYTIHARPHELPKPGMGILDIK